MPRKKELKVTDYHDFTHRGMSTKERRKLDVGDLWINGIVCLSCETFIRSRNRHDFRHCPCGNAFVDGGSWYGRYGANLGLNSIEIVTVQYDHVLPLSEQLELEEWPTTKKTSRASSASTTGRKRTKSVRTSPSSSTARTARGGQGTKSKRGKK